MRIHTVPHFKATINAKLEPWRLVLWRFYLLEVRPNSCFLVHSWMGRLRRAGPLARCGQESRMKKGPRCTRVSDKGLGWAFLPLKSTINFLKIDYLPACGRQIPKITYMIGVSRPSSRSVISQLMPAEAYYLNCLSGNTLSHPLLFKRNRPHTSVTAAHRHTFVRQ